MSTSLSITPDQAKQSLLACRTAREVALLLDAPYSVLIWHARKSPQGARYQSFTIPKRSGGIRHIWAPASALKILQSKLAYLFQSAYRPRPSAHGFLPDRSVVTNAREHCRCTHVLNIDIENFFGSINFGRVRGLLLGPPYRLGADAATVIAQLCCHNNQLPTGAPSSPILANMICAKLDGEMQRLAARYRCTYTRYADDISISCTAQRFPDALAVRPPGQAPSSTQLGPALAHILGANGFTANPKKTRLQSQSERQEVTGLLVNRDPNVPREYVRQIRAMLHAWRKFGLAAAESEHLGKYRRKHREPGRGDPPFARILKGKLDYLSMVRGKDDRLVNRLAEAFASLAGVPFHGLLGAPEGSSSIDRALWVLECPTCMSQGTGFLLRGAGLVTCAHVVCDHLEAFRPQDPTTKFSTRRLGSVAALDLALMEIVGLPADAPRLCAGTSNATSRGDEIIVWGFPNYRLHDTAQSHRGRVSGYRTVSTVRRLLVDAPIVAGNSGGPVLNHRNEVIGVAVTGADRIEDAHRTEDHGVIPIEVLRQVPVTAPLGAAPNS